MRTFAQSALTVTLAAALLGGCGGSQPPINAPGAMPQTSALAARADGRNYKVLHSFTAGNDGYSPFAALIDVKGTLYGTTFGGGAYYGDGTVFSITTGGTEKVLHSFGASSDGEHPAGSLLDVGGTLYGTTAYGGSYDSYGQCGYTRSYLSCGTVFSVTPSGTEKVLHSFRGQGYSDGSNPYASLIKVKDTLYGTTERGGSHKCILDSNCGTVFSITASGTEKVLHSFGGYPDGSIPSASLTEVKGTLYGTTQRGGEDYCLGSYYSTSYTLCGTVFSITTSGSEKVLHSFNLTDGGFPWAGLIDVDGRLYGTTSDGGPRNCNNPDCGTVFSVTPSGTEKVLHAFRGGTGGGGPYAPLINVKGTLYGTTARGGSNDEGTVFSITPSGEEKVLHSFGSGTDGAHPNAGLINVDGTLYGTTIHGGTHDDGTVFALTP